VVIVMCCISVIVSVKVSDKVRVWIQVWIRFKAWVKAVARLGLGLRSSFG
jgi:hypothetical protein